MQMSRTVSDTWRSPLVAVAVGLILALLPGASIATQDATPAVGSCADVQGTPTAGMPAMDHGAMHSSTPDAHRGHDMNDEMPEFDLMYIDMMIPHHKSIIALAQVALPELNHPELIEIAEAIIETQDTEIDMLRELRQEWYGDAATVSMEMMGAMPGMGSDMAHMEQQMSAEWQVQNFCAAENKDLAFIEQTIPHHQMAVDTSEDALEQAVHPELVEIAEDVIATQEAEIQELERIRGEITGEATPSVP